MGYLHAPEQPQILRPIIPPIGLDAAHKLNMIAKLVIPATPVTRPNPGVLNLAGWARNVPQDYVASGASAAVNCRESSSSDSGRLKSIERGPHAPTTVRFQLVPFCRRLTFRLSPEKFIRCMPAPET